MNFPDLSTINKKIEALPVSKLSKLDGILGDAANEVYDTYEYITELKPGTVLTKKEIASMKKLLKQTTALIDLLDKMNYDSKYMDRLRYQLVDMEEELPKILKTKI